MNRREFSIFSLCVISASVLSGISIKKFYKAKEHLRPPGSVENFESLCIKCGQCVQVCPYHSISLLGFDDGFNLASAYINPYERGCYLCDLFPCVLACPSGALNHNTTTIDDVKMGIGVVVNQNACYAYLQKKVSESEISHLLLRKTHNEREQNAKNIIKNNLNEICALCVSSCPINAINFENNIPKINKNCVGCGVCAEVCFAKVIKIVPNKIYKNYKEN